MFIITDAPTARILSFKKCHMVNDGPESAGQVDLQVKRLPQLGSLVGPSNCAVKCVCVCVRRPDPPVHESLGR